MTLTELRDKADAKLVLFWKALVPKQDAYFAKHGKYFQLLLSPSEKVIDGVDTVFTVIKREDNMFVADVDFKWIDKVPFQIEVHDTEESDGTRGFKASVEIYYGNDLYRRERTNLNIDTGWNKITI